MHIAGTVYDHMCDTCAAQTDMGFYALVDAVVDAALADDSREA
jgi:hypothetical protein